jgi:hypothetical protein
MRRRLSGRDLFLAQFKPLPAGASQCYADCPERRHMSGFRFRRLAALALLLGGSGIYADSITVNGDGFFTKYSGPATDGTSFETVVKPSGAACANCFIVPVTPGTVDQPPLRTGIGLGLGSESYAPGVPSLDFFDVISGGDMEALNQIQFTPSCPSCSGGITPGTPFKIGTLSVLNGNFFFDAAASFTFQISYQLTDPAGGVIINDTFSDTVVYVSTKFQTTNTDQQNADYFYFENHQALGVIGVYESGVSAMQPVGFSWPRPLLRSALPLLPPAPCPSPRRPSSWGWRPA